MANRLNASMLRRWIKEAGESVPIANKDTVAVVPTFVQLTSHLRTERAGVPVVQVVARQQLGSAPHCLLEQTKGLPPRERGITVSPTKAVLEL